MKVAVFIPNIKTVCGCSTVGKSLVTGLMGRGISVYLVTNSESDLSFCTNLNLEILILPCDPDKKSFFSIIRSIKALRDFVKSHQIEVINTHHRYAETISILMRMIFRKKVKIVTTVHSYTNDKKIISYRADKLIAVSGFIKNHLTNYYQCSRYKTELIYNGIEENIEENFGTIEENKKIILGFGRLDYEKGFDLLIRAYSSRKEKLEGYRLFLVGEGSEELNLLNLAKQCSISLKIIKHATTPWKLIQKADFIVIPSRTEPLGLVILEGGILGKCVIASETGGIPEIITHDETGLLFESENYLQLAELIERVICGNQLASSLGNALKKKVEKQFSLDEMIDRYIDVFKKLINDNQRETKCK